MSPFRTLLTSEFEGIDVEDCIFAFDSTEITITDSTFTYFTSDCTVNLVFDATAITITNSTITYYNSGCFLDLVFDATEIILTNSKFNSAGFNISTPNRTLQVNITMSSFTTECHQSVHD